LAESLRVAHKSGALRSKDLKRVTVDTTVQPKNISFPTDAKLLHAAIKGLNRLASKHGVRLRQLYLRVAKRAAMMAGRYAHAKQFNRLRRELRILRTRLGRLIRALPGNPYDGHTLREVIEALTGCEIERGNVDKGYRGHDTENPRRVFISGQKRGVFGIIKRELRRRSAIEPVIGHLRAEGHLGRCYLKGRAGDAGNAILSAIGYNFRRILAWLRVLLRRFLVAILRRLISRSALNPAS
jgi:hypothetical protein